MGEEMANEAVRQAPLWPAQDADMALPDLAWSFATAGVWNVDLMDMISEMMARRLQNRKIWHVCALAWSYKKLEKHSGKRFERFQSLLQTQISRQNMSWGEALQQGERGASKPKFKK